MELFNPHSGQWLLNKFEIYKELRSSDVAYYSEKYQMYIITRYDDVIYALGDPETFSSAKGNLIIESIDRFGLTLGASDNPRHDIFKNIVKKAYSKENIQRISDSFSERAIELLSEKESINISDIIEELSAWTCAEIINFPYDKVKIKNLILGMQRHSSRAVTENIDESCSDEFRRIIEKYAVTDKSPAPGPGIYNEFITNNPANYHLLSLFMGPALSGASSLTGALEFLTLDIFRENQLDSLLADRSLIPNVINESLRFHASTGRFSRTVTKDITLHNVKLKPGDRVALCLESANRDSKMFPDPDKFNPARNTQGHLAFGYGLHACIALAINKAIMAVYLTKLLDIVGRFKVTTANTDLVYVMTASGNDDMISNIHLVKI